MKLYVCYGTFRRRLVGGHPCAHAHEALKAAGHTPEIIKAHGLGPLPDALNTRKRREVKRLTGSSWVPALVLDDGTAVSGSQEIAAWAAAHRA